ncbi:MAG: hypothetical protein HY289_10100 [Planctomycetes bacterium]|nr:hypothetical protein [Planctomycetota bacterium]
MANVVLPKVRMFIPCLAVDLEPGLVRTVYGPLHTIRMPPDVDKNYLLDEITFYIVLTDGVGAFRLKVEMRGEDDIVLKRSDPVLCRFRGGMQLDSIEIAITVRSAPIARAGLYEFHLIANHASLHEGGVAVLRVLPE